ncbi:TolC family type I secretion outer membrane protein [Limoniibacter endophyticus]|uniref:TolC family type I secretion outer membrane protein n=1 Tax=Limoniibacter endophyticus TaxID=1565040 RepID=A0A8J3DI15_9HYPH|nr:TolC family type I secretion outer membrane protein [Limoniibacter endophyticus]
MKRAVSFHPSLGEATARIGQYEAEIDVARAGYYPKISGGINSNYDRRADREGFNPRATVQASQMVYDFGKVSGAVNVASAQRAVQQTELLLQTDNLVRDVAYAVIEVDRYQKLLAVAQQQVNGVEDIAKLVRQRSDTGASTLSDKIQAEARLQAAQSRVLELSAQLARWQTTLSSLTGTSVHVSGAVFPASFSKHCATGEPDWNTVPAIQQAVARRGEAMAHLSKSRADSLPTFSLDADAGYDLSGNSRSRHDEDEPEFTVGLNVRGNIYEGGANKARRNAANFALGAADAARQSAQLEVMEGLSAARSQIQGLSALQASLEKRDGMIAQTRDLYKRQYLDLGTRTLLDLLNAEQELHAARFERVNAASDLMRLNADCLYNSGRTRGAFGLQGIATGNRE